MKALIVEDEPRARKVLENLLRTHFPDVQVVGATDSVKETAAWLAAHKADVIFMDVELSDGSCFDLFSRTKVDAEVVMTTAYDNYAVKAFEINSVDYLLKPVEVKDLTRAVERVRSRLDTAPLRTDFTRVLEAFQKAQKADEGPEPGPAPAEGRREKFLIRLNDRIVPVHVHDIAYFYSESKNSYILTRSGVTYVLDDSLDAIEESLPPKQFFRISRSVIVAESAIDSISKILGGRLRITPVPGLSADTDLTVSRSRADAFLSWLEG